MENKGVITFDTSDMYDLLQTVEKLSQEKPRYFIEVDTQSDQFALVWSFEKLTKEEAQKYWKEFWEEEE
jgi:hypothetical protein